MLNVEQFIKSMLLESDDVIVGNAIAYERNFLRNIYASSEYQTTGMQSLVRLAEDTVNVIAVGWERQRLYRATHRVLDAIDPLWQNQFAIVPRAYVWREEEDLQMLRLWPTPMTQGRLEVIKFVAPTEGVALVHDLIISLSALGRAAFVDTLRQRPEIEQFTSSLLEEIYGSLATGSLRA